MLPTCSVARTSLAAGLSPTPAGVAAKQEGCDAIDAATTASQADEASSQSGGQASLGGQPPCETVSSARLAPRPASQVDASTKQGDASAEKAGAPASQSHAPPNHDAVALCLEDSPRASKIHPRAKTPDGRLLELAARGPTTGCRFLEDRRQIPETSPRPRGNQDTRLAHSRLRSSQFNAACLA
jgi:hypothetical protein